MISWAKSLASPLSTSTLVIVKEEPTMIKISKGKRLFISSSLINLQSSKKPKQIKQSLGKRDKI